MAGFIVRQNVELANRFIYPDVEMLGTPIREQAARVLVWHGFCS
jgi:hypothetical protein